MSRLGRRMPIGAKAIVPFGAQPQLFLQALDVTSTFTAALAKNFVFSRLLEVTSAFTAALTTRLTFSRLLAVTSTFTAALTRQATFFRTLAVTSTFTVAIQKLVFKTLAVASVFGAAVTKLLFKTLEVTSVFSAAVVTRATYLRTLAVSGAAWAAALATLFIPGGPGPAPEEDIVPYLKRLHRERLEGKR